MLKTIIIREIQEYIKSKKFLIGLLVIVALVVLSTIINVRDYARRQQDYLTASQEKDSKTVRIYRPPQVLSILSRGKDTKYGNLITLDQTSIAATTSGYMGERLSQSKRFKSGLTAIDFNFIVKIVLSLLVIFYAYNSISEEKANGTLKQVFSNNIARDKFLVGKFIGGLIVIIISLVIATLITLLIIQFHSAVKLNTSDWIRIILMLGVSTLYLTVFYTLSLFISVTINRPSTALMVLLQIWLFLLFIYPSVGICVAKKWYNVPSIQEIKLQAILNFLNLDRKYGGIRKTKFDSKIHRKVEDIPYYEYAIGIYTLKRNFETTLNHQVEFSQNITLVSPAVLYDRIMERLARTGNAELEKYFSNALPYYRMLIRENLFLGPENKTFPKYSYSSEKTIDSVYAITPDFFLLFLIGTVFFAFAYVAFLRKDVR